jgi:diguanylate cyclase (GGDEF)-like protein
MHTARRHRGGPIPSKMPASFRTSVHAAVREAQLHGRRRLAVALAALVAAGGIAGSVLGARSVARSDSHARRLAFNLASREVASTLRLAIEHEEDLVVTASAFVASNPAAPPVAFDRWAQVVHAMQRYPELENIGLVVLVPAAQLRAFEARLAAEPVEPLGPHTAGLGSSFTVLPPGARPYYCFAVSGLARDLRSYIPAGVDYCALAGTLVNARDTGQSSYAPVAEGGRVTLGVQTPVYREGVVPSTVTARRRAFVGWLGELLLPSVVLSRALQGHSATQAVLSYAAGGSHVSFSAGHAPRGSQVSTLPVGGGWAVRTYGDPLPGGLFADRNATMLLLFGVLLTLLATTLSIVLATGRMRAIALVREKTRELSRMALHDPLTGLPNRTLVMDRADLMLARAERRPEVFVGALYVDLDGFKHVNDTCGHAAGDELLCALAERLRSTVRPQDTVGRLGGDEFVVLFEAPDERAIAVQLAERITEALRAPVALSDGRELEATASVGVAAGRYDSTDRLLRDADLALYAAKDGGRNRYVVYQPALEAELRVHASA